MTSRPVVAVIGGGPAGVAAARRLRDAGAAVLLVAPGGSADYLPGTADVALGRVPAAHFRCRLSLPGVEIVPGVAEAVSGDGLRVGGSRVRADAVIAAPGLVAEAAGAPGGGTVAFWDPAGAALAAPAIASVNRGLIAVVISSLPYRCPPAPYGLGMRLARLTSAPGRPVHVVVTTPEPRPLAALGEEFGAFLLASCQQAGVEVHTNFTPDPAALARGTLVSAAGTRIPASLALVIPSHRRSPVLAGLPGPGPLVTVGPSSETGDPGLYVAGDAAASAYPRAADPAAVSGVVAAGAVIARLGLRGQPAAGLPAPECFVGHSEQDYSRLRLHYPDGPPPGGRAEISVEGPSPGLAAAFRDSFGHWCRLRGPQS